MKLISAILSIFFTFSFAHSQNKGSITVKGPGLSAGMVSNFVYDPPQNLSVPDKLDVLLLYKDDSRIHNKIFHATKHGNQYEFSFTVPDATVLIMGIVDANRNLANFSPFFATQRAVIDNNESGYIFYLNENSNKNYGLAKLALADLYQKDAGYFLDIKIPNRAVIDHYRSAYKLFPALKDDDSYQGYLDRLFEEDNDKGKSLLLDYAMQLRKNSGSEKKLQAAMNIYNQCKMDKEAAAIKKEIMAKFPAGDLAKAIFWQEFYTAIPKTEQAIMAVMENYNRKFSGIDSKAKKQFDGMLIDLAAKNGDLEKIYQYEHRADNSFIIGHICNKYAWQLCGPWLDSGGTDLPTARLLSLRALDHNSSQLARAIEDGENEDEALGERNQYLNTYAAIMYKLGFVDSAFYFQDLVYRQGDALNTEGMERYAVYAEKAKGLNYARQFIEEQLLSGVSSTTMQKQLMALYSKLDLPQAAFATLQEKTDRLASEKKAAAIIAKFGTTKATDFSLKNMKGQTVQLSSLKNKVVVLDFWATWCGPCKASFPAMQKLVTKYQKDTNVVFLFIDVWDNGKGVQDVVRKYIKDNRYNFNVLFDVNKKVVADYKIKGIPSKFVINKAGDLSYIGNDDDVPMSVEETIKKFSALIEDAGR